MKIAKLTISNFLKLKDVEMNPSHTNVIVGKNKQGKTSVLKAIKAAFTGDVDSTSIRIGETKAEITIELDDLTVRRTVTESGNYLDVSNKEGFKVPSPQKYLNGILGTFSFNPVDFFMMKPTDRKKYLLKAIDMHITQEELSVFTGEKLAGLDYAGLHALEIVKQAYDYYYAQRTTVNSEVSKKQKTMSELSSKLPEGFTTESFDESKIEGLRKQITTNEVNKQKLLDCTSAVDGLKTQIQRLKDQMNALQTELNEKNLLLNELGNSIKDVDGLYVELNAMESQRSLVFTAQQIDASRIELSESLKNQERLDVIVKRLANEVPQKLIEKIDLPIQGLSITEDDVLVNGVSLDNLSTSEQLKFGLDIVRKLNEKFQVICIDGIESLDAQSFELFLKEIENDDFQYFCTRVDSGVAVQNGIMIEDGEIK